MDGHVVADEQEVVRARAAADLLDAHEHEHHDLDHDRVEIGRTDDEALPDRVEPSVRERPGRDARAPRPGSRVTTSPTVNGSERFAWTSVPAKSAKPAPIMSAPVHRSGRRDEATRPADDERDAGHDREGGQRGAVARSWPRWIAAAASRRAGGSGDTDSDDDRVRAELGAGCCERGQPRSSRQGSPPFRTRALTRRPPCRHATAEKESG